MASNVGNIKVKLSMDKSAYEAGIKSATGAIKQLSGALGALGIGFSALKLVEAGKNAIKASSNFEQANISFEVMLGSAEKAQKLVRDLEQMGNVTPFETQDLLEASKVLLNFGVSLEEIMPDLQMLGDISGGNKDKMQSLTLAFAQMSSAGRLMGQDLLQMINAGFNPLQVMSEKTGKSMAELKEAMGKGQISVNAVRQAFVDATSEGGRFYGMMDKQSQSLEGLSSTMNDAYTLMTRSISDLALPLLKEQVVEITNVINGLTANIAKMREWAAANQSTVESIKSLITILSVAAIGTFTIQRGVTGLIAAYTGLVAISGKVTYSQIAISALLQGQVKVAFAAATAGVKAFTAALLANPIGLIIGGIAIAIGALIGYVTNCNRQFKELTKNNQALVDGMGQTIASTEAAEKRFAELSKKINRTAEEEAELIELEKQHKKVADTLAISFNKNVIPSLKNTASVMENIKKQAEEGKVSLAAYAQLAVAFQNFNAEMQSIEKAAWRTSKNTTDKQITDANNRFTTALQTYNRMKDAASNVSKGSAGVSSNYDLIAGKEKKGKKGKDPAKEKLDYELALLDIKKYETRKTEEEIYQIELQQANLRVASAKKGTSDYAQALAAKLRLEQEHARKVEELQAQRTIDDIEYNKQDINGLNMNLALQYEAQRISKVRLLELEIANIQKKKELEKKALAVQLKLVEGNAADEIKIKRASVRVQEELDREITSKYIELQREKQAAFKGFTENVTSGFGNTVSGLLKGEMDLADAFTSVTDTLVNSFSNAVGKMVETWLVNHLTMESITRLFGIQKATTDAGIIAGNMAVQGSNAALLTSSVGLAGAQGALMTENALLATSSTAVAASTGAAAGTTAASAGVMAGAAVGIGAAITAIVSPVAALAAAFATLALSTATVALTMPIIAIATTVVALSSALAALGLGLMNTVMLLTATTSMMFAPVSVLLAAEFAIIGAAAMIAAKGVAALAISLAAASAAAIPFVGWALAPAAATATGAAIAGANAMVNFGGFMEDGGQVKKGSAYIVGEKRPELFVPDRNGTIIPDTSALNGGGGGTYNEYSIKVAMPISATDAKSFEGRIDEFTDRIHSNLARKIKQRKLKPLPA